MARNGRNEMLDMFKWVAACMVVFIHVPFPGAFGIVVESAARFAVPFYFMVSGYFSYQDEISVLKRKAKYIFCLYLGAALLYFLYRLVLVLKYGMETTPAAYLLSYTNLRAWCQLLLLNYSRTGHLWFLLSLLYCYGLEWLRRRCRIQNHVIYVVSAVLLGIHLVLGEGFSVFGVKIPYYFLRNFLLMGYPFFAMGIRMREREEMVQKCSRLPLFLCVIVGTAEAIVSEFMFGANEMYVGSVLVAFSLFCLAVKGAGRTYPKWATALFATNLFLYIFHILAESLLIAGMQFLGIPMPSAVWEWILPIATCAVTVAFALVYEKLVHRMKK